MALIYHAIYIYHEDIIKKHACFSYYILAGSFNSWSQQWEFIIMFTLLHIYMATIQSLARWAPLLIKMRHWNFKNEPEK